MWWWRSALVSGTKRAAKNRPISPIGTLTKKIARHPVPPMLAETRPPPSSCPATAASPPVAPNQPSARDLDSRLPVAWMVDSVCGTISAAERALQHAGDDQRGGRRRERAQQRGEGEGADADQEQPPPAVRVAEPAAEDEEYGVRGRVAGHDQLEDAGRGMQVDPHGRAARR